MLDENFGAMIAHSSNKFDGDDDDVQTLVVIGNGMMSHRLCRKLVDHRVHMHARIVVFGEERHPAYDRAHLTDIYSGESPEALILAKETWYEENGIELYLGDPIVLIDREEGLVESASGARVPYNRLVIATGSEPFVPPIEGIRVSDEQGELKLQKRVFVYRTFDDVYTIEAGLEYASRVVVLGGGRIGLEVARAVDVLTRRMGNDTQVEVVDSAPRLMAQQLDNEAAALVKETIEKSGIRVYLRKNTTKVEYDEMADQLQIFFDDGSMLEVDMLIVATGYRPRSELARAAGLECAANGGIIVDDKLRTSDEQIYAIGECASRDGISYRLVGPGYEMVDVLVAQLMGETASFTKADQSIYLDRIGVNVAFLGEYDGDTKPQSSALRYTTGGVYRKLVARQGRLIGAIVVGEWDELFRIRKAIAAPVLMSFWDLRRFRATGNLFKQSVKKKITEWADDAIVCACAQVTLGQLNAAIKAGATTVRALSRQTGAGETCGACNHLLAESVSGLEPEKTSLVAIKRQNPDRRIPKSNPSGSPSPIAIGRPGSPARIGTGGVPSVVMPAKLPGSIYRTPMAPELPDSYALDKAIDHLYNPKKGLENSKRLPPDPRPLPPTQSVAKKTLLPIDIAPTMADITAAEFDLPAPGNADPLPPGPKGRKGM